MTKQNLLLVGHILLDIIHEGKSLFSLMQIHLRFKVFLVKPFQCSQLLNKLNLINLQSVKKMSH